MTIRTAIVCLPVRDLERTLEFYKTVLGFWHARIEEGIVALELPNLSLFLMAQDAFETYSKKAGRKAQFPNGSAGLIISCAMASKEAMDAILENASKHGGDVRNDAAMDEASGGYIGYFSDPDGYLWELVERSERSAGQVCAD